MRADALLSLLESRGVRLSSRDGKLVCNAPRGVLTAELRGHIGRLKPDLLTLLEARADGAARPRLSPAQRRIRDLARLLPAASPAGNIPLGFEVRGPLTADRLAAALAAVVEGHPVFRTVCADDGARVERDVAVPVERVDLRAAADRDAALTAHVQRRIAEPFDLSRAPVLRATLFRVDDETRVVLVLTHVFAFDGRSTPLFTAALSAALAGRPTQTPAVYAELARSMGGADPAAGDFWVAALAGVDLRCPLTARPGAPSAPAGHLPVDLGPRRSAALTALARTCRATLFHAVMAAFQAALHHVSRQPSLAVGTIVSHRRGVAAEGTIGSFAHNVLFPARFPAGLTFRALVAAQRDHARKAMGHLEQPVEAALGRFEGHQRRGRLYETMCVMHHGAAAPTLIVDDLDVRPFAAPKARTAHGLDLVLAEHEGVITGELSHDAERIAPAAAEALLRAFVDVIDRACADPDVVVADPGAARPAAPPPPSAGDPPRSPHEASIAGIWGELLDRETIARDADFYALGGHSLLALTMLAAVEARHGALPTGARSAFAEAPTVATIGALLTR